MKTPKTKTLTNGTKISLHLVTTDEWNEVMNDNRPAGMTLTMVSAEEADSFAAKLGARLPTEKEWEELCGKENVLGAFWEWTSTKNNDLLTQTVRGGSWLISSDGLRIGARSSFYFGSRYVNAGFRLVWDK